MEPTNTQFYEFVEDAADFPPALNGIRYLADNTTYVITGIIDLQGDRLVIGRDTAIIGGSSESSVLKSTNLINIPLLTCFHGLTLRDIGITADLAVSLDASHTPNQAAVWFGVNFVDCQNIGTIKGYNNFLLTDAAIVNSAGMVFDGAMGTIGFSQVFFNSSIDGTIITIPDTASVSRRFRIIYSAFVLGAATTGIDVHPDAITVNESYILDTVNFSGAGDYLETTDNSSNKALFINCVGITNTGNIGHYYMVNNATATTIAVQSVYYKVAGTTTTGPYTEKFTITDNRATYVGSRVGFYKVTAVSALSSGNNNVILMSVFKNGVLSASSITASTTSPSGKSENTVCQDVVSLSTGDYVEIFVANDTSTTAVTVEDLSVIVERLN